MGDLSKFDPEGDGYDYESARAAGLKPDKTGHWPSRHPKTGMLLKGAKHKTFRMGVDEDLKMGYRLVKRGGRYYTVKASGKPRRKPLKTGG